MKIFRVDNNITPMTYRPVFRANIKSAEFGRLQQGTANRFRTLMNAYNEIQSKLSRMTAEGIEHINNDKNLNVTVNEGIGFTNCGKNGVYIVLRAATTEMYKDLMRIIVRKSNSLYGNKQMLDSFMLYRDDRAVTNFEPNRSKQFPDECILASEKELKSTKYDKRLQKTISMLEMPILKFRQYLNRVPAEYLRKPDGILEYKYQTALRDVANLNKETEALEKSLSHSTLYNYKRDNCPTYLLHPGLKSFAFKDLGPEKLTIQCADVESAAEEPFKRMVVSDKDGNNIATYIINNNEKIVKNRSLTNFHYDSKSNSELIYLDSDEINDKEFLDKFQTYLDLYTNELKLYNQKLKAFIDTFKATKISGELSEEIQNNLEMSVKLSKELINNEKFHNKELEAVLKEYGVSYISDKMRSGMMFLDYLGGARSVQLLPLNNSHGNLIKLSILDPKGFKTRRYLIKDYKHVVKNYNQYYHQKIPENLIYYPEDEMDSIKIDGVMRYFTDKLKQIKQIVDNAEIYKKPVKPETYKERVRAKTPQKKCYKENPVKSKSVEQVCEEGRREFENLPSKNPAKAGVSLKEYDDYHNNLLSWRRYFKLAADSIDDFDKFQEYFAKLYSEMKDYIISKNKD